MQRHNENGLAFAQWAAKQPKISAVHYPGLESHPDHALAAETLTGFGGMVGLQVKGGARAADKVLKRLRVAFHAPSLGGVETLVSLPVFMSRSLAASRCSGSGLARTLHSHMAGIVLSSPVGPGRFPCLARSCWRPS